MVHSIARFLLDPFNIMWLLVLLAGLSWYIKRKRLFKFLLFFSVLWFLITSTPLASVIIINSLEDRYNPLDVELLNDRNAEYHIIVLGGGHGFDPRLPANSKLSQTALGRLSEGIRLHRQLPNSKLLLSGSTSSPGKTTQAEMLQKTAVLLGIDKASTIIQKEPVNTYQEARIYASQYGNSHPVILVTSATHMPRAMMMFKRFGIKPIPSPANYLLQGGLKHTWFGPPSLDNMERFRIGITSYAAIIRYQIWD